VRHLFGYNRLCVSPQNISSQLKIPTQVPNNITGKVSPSFDVIFFYVKFDVTVFNVTVFDVTVFDVTFFDVTVFDVTVFDVTVFDVKILSMVTFRSYSI